MDALRGIAALGVMAYHYTVRYPESVAQRSPQTTLFAQGHLGVDLFFVISGFVIFLTLSRSSSIAEFAWNRFARLFPTYWIAIILTFVTTYWSDLTSLKVTIPQALINSTMAQYWLGVPHVDIVYWTLEVELAFYVCVGTIAAFGLLHRAEVWIGAWLLVQTMVHLIAMTDHPIPPIIRHTFLLNRGHFFFVGILFYRIKTLGPSRSRTFLIFACIGMAWLAREKLDEYEHAVTLAGVSLVFFLFIHQRLIWLRLAWLEFFGRISYPLYLLHNNIGCVIISKLERLGMHGMWWLLIPSALSIGLATLIHVTIEIPSHHWLRRLRTRFLAPSTHT